MDKKSLSEEDIKLKFITPAIAKSWDIHNQIRMEYAFTDGRIMVRGKHVARGRQKRADYMLSYKNIPLAIVEAKDNTHPVGGGIQQALEYAEILDIPFVYSSNGDAFVEYDREQGREIQIALENFPSPDALWQRYKKLKAITADEEKVITQPYYFQIGDKLPAITSA